MAKRYYRDHSEETFTPDELSQYIERFGKFLDDEDEEAQMYN